MREKVALVCQRYGLEVNGGSELHCRHLAEKLSAFYCVEVYTTCCADDYVTWKNSFQPGTETINGVIVHRFQVTKMRNLRTFNSISEQIIADPSHSVEDELRWVDEQGPVCPELLEQLKAVHQNYKVIIFMTYLYYLTAMGLPLGFENALLVPTAHDEFPMYFRYYERVFCSAKGFIWNTLVEKNFVEGRFPKIKNTPGVIAGVGVDVPDGDLPDIPQKIQNSPYIVYAGRIDNGKGCGEMFRFFRRYKQQYGGSLQLVLMGKAVMEVPEADDIVNLGFVSEELKFAVMRSAQALVLFSPLESLSAVVLESMCMGRPVVVNGKCAVLKEHCLRSNAGLYFENYSEFAAILNYLRTHKREYQIMCENGKKYISENYQWDVIIQRIRQLIEDSVS